MQKAGCRTRTRKEMKTRLRSVNGRRKKDAEDMGEDKLDLFD